MGGKLKLMLRLCIAVAALGAGGAANAAEEKFRIALKAETVASGKMKIGVENRSQVLLHCRYLQPDGRMSEVDPLAPGATFWIGVLEGPAGKWNCQKSTKDPPDGDKLFRRPG